MPAPPIRSVAALAALTTACAVTFYRLHLLRRALDAERAARRLTAGQQHQDWQPSHDRLHTAIHAHRVVAEADQVLTDALTSHTRIDPEGGTP